MYGCGSNLAYPANPLNQGEQIKIEVTVNGLKTAPKADGKIDTAALQCDSASFGYAAEDSSGKYPGMVSFCLTNADAIKDIQASGTKGVDVKIVSNKIDTTGAATKLTSVEVKAASLSRSGNSYTVNPLIGSDIDIDSGDNSHAGYTYTGKGFEKKV
jgi:hypothetical protein